MHSPKTAQNFERSQTASHFLVTHGLQIPDQISRVLPFPLQVEVHEVALSTAGRPCLCSWLGGSRRLHSGGHTKRPGQIKSGMCQNMSKPLRPGEHQIAREWIWQPTHMVYIYNII